MKKWMVSAIVVALSVGLFCCQGWLMSQEGFDTVRAVKADNFWCVYHEEKVPRQKADQLIAADGVLYLYYESLGYVNAYRTDGSFLRAYQVATGQNGVGGIGYAHGTLYINGRCSGVYAFSGEEFRGFEEQSIHNPNYDVSMDIVRSDRPVTDGGYTYYYNAEAGTVTRSKPGQALETVVQLPVKDAGADALGFANLALWMLFAFWYDGIFPEWVQKYHDRKKWIR